MTRVSISKSKQSQMMLSHALSHDPNETETKEKYDRTICTNERRGKQIGENAAKINRPVVWWFMQMCI